MGIDTQDIEGDHFTCISGETRKRCRKESGASMIGVLGSSGHVGSLLADMLKAKGYELRLGSRSAGFIVNMTDPSSCQDFSMDAMRWLTALAPRIY